MTRYDLPVAEPLIVASYSAGPPVKAYLVVRCGSIVG
jgi:hypothetical protein